MRRRDAAVVRRNDAAFVLCLRCSKMTMNKYSCECTACGFKDYGAVRDAPEERST